MKQRTLGQSGITVSEIGLGCMSMNFGYGRPSPEKDMIELIHRAVDLGVTLFDTAESYGPTSMKSSSVKLCKAYVTK